MSGTKRPGHTLSVVDSASNLDIADVIGQKGDSHNGNSLYSINERTDEHFHSIPFNYPTLANGITVTGHADAWTLGSFVEIIPENTITEDFDLHWISVSNISANDTYELYLYNGTTLIGVAPEFSRITGAGTLVAFRFQCPVQAANSQIQAKLASKAGGSRTLDVKLNGHPY